MKLKADLINESSLISLATEAVRLLLAGSFESLANQFGYAVALDRDPALAIQEDLNQSLSDVSATGLDTSSTQPIPTVRFFASSMSGLLGVIECQVKSNAGSEILLELVISAVGDEKHLTLEQISAAA